MRAKMYLDKGLNIIEDVKDQEEDCLSNIPENLQSCERYDKMESTIDKLDEAIDGIVRAQEYIDDAAN